MRLTTEIKNALKKEFPAIKFSARQTRNHVTIEWKRELGSPATLNAVREICEQFSTSKNVGDCYDPIYIGTAIYYNFEASDELQEYAKQEVLMNWGDSIEWHEWGMFVDSGTEYRHYHANTEYNQILADGYTEEIDSIQKDLYYQETEKKEEIKEEIKTESDEEITENIVKVTPYMVTAKTPKMNKNNTIAEYIEQLENPDDYTIEKYQVCYEMKLSNKDWNTLMMNLMVSRKCFEGKGGTSSMYSPGFEIKTFEDFGKMNDLQSKLWRKNSYSDDCILVKNGWNSIVIDPQGYSYAKYVGLDVKPV